MASAPPTVAFPDGKIMTLAILITRDNRMKSPQQLMKWITPDQESRKPALFVSSSVDISTEEPPKECQPPQAPQSMYFENNREIIKEVWRIVSALEVQALGDNSDLKIRQEARNRQYPNSKAGVYSEVSSAKMLIRTCGDVQVELCRLLWEGLYANFIPEPEPGSLAVTVAYTAIAAAQGQIAPAYQKFDIALQAFRKALKLDETAAPTYTTASGSYSYTPTRYEYFQFEGLADETGLLPADIQVALDNIYPPLIALIESLVGFSSASVVLTRLAKNVYTKEGVEWEKSIATFDDCLREKAHRRQKEINEANRLNKLDSDDD